MFEDVIPTLTNEELAALAQLAEQELQRRQRIATYEQTIDALLLSAAEDRGTTAGAAWVQPTGAHDAYPKGWRVAFGGKEWESLVTGNAWAPGVSGWREVPTAGGGMPPEWVQPTGAHDAYPHGAEVTYNAAKWRSTIAANVWAPGVYGWDVVPT